MKGPPTADELGMVLGKGKKPASGAMPGLEEEEGAEDDAELETAAQEFLDAQAAGDAAGLAAAFKAMHAICNNY